MNIESREDLFHIATKDFRSVANQLSTKCEGGRFKSLIEEGEELVGEDPDDSLRYTGLIDLPGRVEHHDIAGLRIADALAAC